MRARAATSFLLVVLLPFVAPAPGTAQAAEDGGGEVVGSIEVVTAEGTRTFQVREGPPTEGFSTGYNAQPVGESMVLGASIQGWEEGGSARLVIQTGIYRDSMEQLCDPFSNNVELHGGEAEGRRRLRPGGESPATCPDNAVDIEVSEATFDADAETLHVVGTFSGPLGRGDDAIQVTEARFEATLRSFREL